MQTTVFSSEQDIARTAGEIFCGFARRKPKAVFGFATGSTPLGAYSYMVSEYRAGRTSFSQIKTFNLDEYCGLPKDHQNSFFAFMQQNLFSQTDIVAENIHFLDGTAADVRKECERYDAKINAAGGIDVQLLGIGCNGHIGFNEPGNYFSEGSFKVKLTANTMEENSVYFDDAEMPGYALTMGIGSIFRARKIVLIALGEQKAQAINEMLRGKITPRCPASILKLHDNVSVFLDETAASLVRDIV